MIEQNTEGLEGNSKAAAQMAINNQRLNKGVSSLNDNWEDWHKTLKSGNKTTEDYAKAMVGIKKSMQDILGVSEETLIPEDFL